MSKLQEYNGHFCESEYEYAFISFLEDEGWHYLPGNSIARNSKTAVLYEDDLEHFLSKTNSDLTVDEIRQIIDSVRLVGAESEFSTLHKVYGWMVDGVQFIPQNGLAHMTLNIPKTIFFVSSISLLLSIQITGRKKLAAPIFFYLLTVCRCVSSS